MVRCSEADVATELRRIGIATPAAFELVAELLGTFESQIQPFISSLMEKGAIGGGLVDKQAMARLGASGMIDCTSRTLLERLDVDENYSIGVGANPVKRKQVVSDKGKERRRGGIV